MPETARPAAAPAAPPTPPEPPAPPARPGPPGPAGEGGPGDTASAALPPAVQAFDAIAGAFDHRFGPWASVAAQRRAVRRLLLAAFPPGSRLLELGGGTGEDALFLAERGRRVFLTDGSPAMVANALAKAERAGLAGAVEGGAVTLEALEDFALARLPGPGRPPAAAGLAPEALEDFARARPGAPGAAFDGAYSNFAALNCVADLRPVGHGLASLLRPGAPALLVVFGPFPPGEVLVETLRGRPRSAFRRLSRGPVPARLGGRRFQVWYHRPRAAARALAPWFRLERVRGIGVFVPPSSAEPFVSRVPGLVTALERLDRLASAPLALLGDHVLLHFVRTDAPAPEAGR